MLYLDLRLELPAIVDGGHREREVEKTSSYSDFQTIISKPFKVTCTQAAKIYATHGRSRFTAVVELSPSR